MSVEAANPDIHSGYPCWLEERLRHGGRSLTVRAIRPTDGPMHKQFMSQIEPHDLYLRFLTGVRELSDEELHRFVHIDYDREMALVAVTEDGAGDEQILALARMYADSDRSAAEFAVLVRSDLKSQGLGTLLMRKLISYCRSRGLKRLWGSVLSENEAMLRLGRSLGFKVTRTDRNVEELALEL